MGKRYVWAVDVGGDAVSSVLLGRLLTVVDGCLVADPTRRMTVSHALEALTKLQCDVAAAGGSGDGPRSPTTPVPPPPLPGAVTYDVLAIVDAMEAVSIDPVLVASVADAIGTSLTSSLDVLTANKVPIMKAMAVRKAAAAGGAAHAATMSVRLRSAYLTPYVPLQ